MNKWKRGDSRRLQPGEHPSVWLLEGDLLRISIHRVFQLEGWFVSAHGSIDIDRVPLKATDLSAAKREGTAFVLAMVQKIADEANVFSRTEALA